MTNNTQKNVYLSSLDPSQSELTASGPWERSSTALDTWLGADGIEGRSIHGKETLCIEVGPDAIVSQVEEVADSDMESESGIESDEGIASGNPCQQLRQLTLLDLFVPKE